MNISCLSAAQADAINLPEIETHIESILYIESQMDIPLRDLHAFRERVSSGGSILDAGCGAGRYVQSFVNHGLDYTGIDLSPSLARVAKSKNPMCRFAAMSVRNLAFASNTFHAVWCGWVLSYLPKQTVPHILHELLRVTQPGGIVYVTQQMLSYEIEILLDSENSYGATCFSVWNPDDFKEMVCTQGFNAKFIPVWNEGSLTTIIRKDAA